MAGASPPQAAPSRPAGAEPGVSRASCVSALTLYRLKTRADFLRAQKAIRRRTEGLTLEACRTPPQSCHPHAVRVGFTASRKVGGAVARNRAKRRLRAAAAALLPLYGCAGSDYVLVAKTETLSRPFQDLLADLAGAIQAANRRLGPPPPGGRTQCSPGQSRD